MFDRFVWKVKMAKQMRIWNVMVTFREMRVMTAA